MYQKYKNVAANQNEGGEEGIGDVTQSITSDLASLTVNDVTAERASRFGGEEGGLIGLSPTVADNKLRAFYGGEGAVAERMSDIRKAIVHVREHWSQYDVMMERLAKFIERAVRASKQAFSEVNLAILTRLHSLHLDWADEVDDEERKKMLVEETGLIRLYTSQEGYKLIFKLVYDSVFRNDDSVKVDFDTVVTAVFLIELFNIQLFNLALTQPTAYADFSGTVYRGTRVSSDVIAAHEQLFTRSLPDRYIAIPLSLQSASRNPEKALEFASAPALPGSDAQLRLLTRVQVFPLIPSLLAEYRQYFPTSVVSTIGAVPIANFSNYLDEDEVILRGAFYQMLKIEKQVNPASPDDPLWVLDGLMLQANRDHISTYRLGVKDALARQFFGAIAKVTRCTHAQKFCRDNHLVSDADGYELLLRDANTELDKIRELCKAQA